VLKNRAVKTYWGTGGKIHVFLTSTVDGSVYPCLWLYGPLPPLRCRPIPSLFGIVPAILVGLLNDICFYEMGSLVLCPTPNLEDQTSVFMTPRDRVARLYPQAPGTHSSRLLRHAWVTLGLFLFPATTRETVDGYTLKM
jgi:hypothetical protein